jgi:hypothetical protein
MISMGMVASRLSEVSRDPTARAVPAQAPSTVTVSATPDEAAARHAALFGAKPLHPGPGQWTWKDGRLGSSAYGTPTSWREPPYRTELGDFGLFEGVSRLFVNMQFEAGGLRAIARWLWNGN